MQWGRGSPAWRGRRATEVLRDGASPVAPILVFAWGNPSRGDDALGPAFLETICTGRGSAPARAGGDIELLAEYQLQVEHTLDLVGRRQIVFVDASVSAQAPFAWLEIQPQRDGSFSSHAMSPYAVLQAFVEVFEESPPPTRLLAIRGYKFELGDALSPQAERNLEAAARFFAKWLARITAKQALQQAGGS
jgi:hydrogenase maturation protease